MKLITTVVSPKTILMNSRISLVLRAKNISPAQLADELGVQRSGISHILNGRNKPSLDFIQKLLKRYPDISMSWIMFGTGPMMNPYPVKEESFKENIPSNGGQASLMNLFPVTDDDDDTEVITEQSKPREIDANGTEKQFSISPVENDHEKVQKNEEVKKETDVKEINFPTSVKSREVKPKLSSGRNITRIVIFYDDKTFTEYFPGAE